MKPKFNAHYPLQKGIIAFFFLLFTKNMLAQSYPQVQIPGSETRKITSSIVNGQEYVLQISLPAGYANSNKRYPIVYLMDSQWDFPLVSALYGQQYYDGFIPEMIIVGITWGGDHPNPDSLRARDYTPTMEQRLPQSGGADKFLSFIKNEVFPFIKKSYRADENDKTLIHVVHATTNVQSLHRRQPGIYVGSFGDISL
jgi:enterochelin esterase-like enzyme